MALVRDENTQAKTLDQAPAAAIGGDKIPKKISALKHLGLNRLSAMTEEEVALLGTNSEDIAFKNLLGNSWNQVSRMTKGQSALGSESVGLILQNVSDHPIKYVEFAQKSKNVMDVDFSTPVIKEAQPGEEFNVNWAEAGYLITRPQYQGKFAGDPEKVISYAPVSPKNPGELPTTKFTLSSGSIAEHTVELAEGDKDDRVVKEQYREKFGIFAEKRAKAPAAARATKKKENLAAIGAGEVFAALVPDLNI